MGGSFAPVWVAAFTWNGWQTSLEYAVIILEARSHTPEGSFLKNRKEPTCRDNAGLADLLEGQHIALITADEIIHFAGNRHRQQQVVIGIF